MSSRQLQSMIAILFLLSVGSPAIAASVWTGTLQTNVPVHQAPDAASPVVSSLKPGRVTFLVTEGSWVTVSYRLKGVSHVGFAQGMPFFSNLRDFDKLEELPSRSSLSAEEETSVSIADVTVSTTATGMHCQESLFEKGYESCSVELEISAASARAKSMTADLACTATVQFSQKSTTRSRTLSAPKASRKWPCREDQARSASRSRCARRPTA